MTNKIKQQIKVPSKVRAIFVELGKRIPYAIGILLLLLFIQGARSYSKTAEGVKIGSANTVQIRKLQEKNNELLKQNKSLTEQGVKQSRENSAHIDCLADLFAEYTRTGQPVYLEGNDLTKCIQIRLASGAYSGTGSGSSQAAQSEPANQSKSTGSASSGTDNGGSSTGNNNGNNTTDNRSNVEKVTDGAVDIVCSAPLLGRVCN